MPNALVTLCVLPHLGSATLANDGETEKYLPGSRISLREAVQSSHIIAVVKVVEVGKPGQPTGSGNLRYHEYRLKLVQLLKGNAPNETFATYLTLRFWPKKMAETLPIKGHVYLFFLEDRFQPSLYSIKVLRATVATIADTKAHTSRSETETAGRTGTQVSRIACILAVRRTGIVSFGGWPC